MSGFINPHLIKTVMQFVGLCPNILLHHSTIRHTQNNKSYIQNVLYSLLFDLHHESLQTVLSNRTDKRDKVSSTACSNIANVNSIKM